MWNYLNTNKENEFLCSSISWSFNQNHIWWDLSNTCVVFIKKEKTILPKAIYRFNVIPIKLLMVFFTELQQSIVKFVWKHKRSWISKTILRKNGAGGILFPDFRRYDSFTVIRTVWYWHKNGHMGQWNRIETRNKPTHLWSVNLEQRRQGYIQWSKHSLFNKWCWENWIATCKRMKSEHSLMTYANISNIYKNKMDYRPKCKT